jgi:guanylate kinase
MQTEDATNSGAGKFILVIGPTGSGKSVLLAYVRETFPNIVFPHTFTTREKRPGMENSAYEFLSVEEFKEQADAGNFIESAEFGGNFYGTSKIEINSELAKGSVLLKEMEVQGVRQIQNILSSEQLVIIYIDAGSWDELERRVRARAPITDEELAKRKQRYQDEVPFKETANFVIKNLPGELEKAKEDIASAINSILI